MVKDHPPRSSFKLRLWLGIAGILAYLFFVASTMALWAWATPLEPIFTAGMSLLMAAALAFVIVTILPIAYGEIEFEALGIKLKGASGPVVLWIICFVVVVAAMKLLW
jgi:hypothetical protein